MPQTIQQQYAHAPPTSTKVKASTSNHAAEALVLHGPPENACVTVYARHRRWTRVARSSIRAGPRPTSMHARAGLLARGLGEWLDRSSMAESHSDVALPFG
jgi:hypothetical protein